MHQVTRWRERLKELRSTEAPWLPFNEAIDLRPNLKALEGAEKLLSERPDFAALFRIFPNSEAGLVFEFETKGWDYSIEFLADGSVEIYGIEINGPGELEAMSFKSPDSNFFKKVDDLLG